jgi:DNA-binding MarR family transcriptional regulator
MSDISAISAIERQQIEELRQEHVGRLLLQAQRAFSVRANEKLRRMGHSGLNLAHTNLIAHLELKGTRITTLAEQVGVTKQAIGHLVFELEEKGYIERAIDPADRRAVLITFTELGWKFLQDASQVKREIEAEYINILGGVDEMQTLKHLLRQLIGSENQAKPKE